MHSLIYVLWVWLAVTAGNFIAVAGEAAWAKALDRSFFQLVALMVFWVLVVRPGRLVSPSEQVKKYHPDQW